MIRLIPDADQQQIIDSIAGYLCRELPVDRLQPNRSAQGKNERELWPELAEQGFFGLGLPEDTGGAEFTVIEEVLACCEFGRFLASPSLLGTMLAAHLAVESGDMRLAGSLVGGETVVSLAAVRGPFDLGSGATGDLHLFDAARGDLVLVISQETVALLERDHLSGIVSVAGMDDTVKLERASAKSVAPRLVSRDGSMLRYRAGLLIAACQVGMAEASRDMAVEYAKTREQFGKPIGSFQSVAHHCANMEVRARAALSQVYFAAIAMRDGRAHAPFQALAAGIVAADAAYENATMAIRVHGGMGYTAECNVHNYLKRNHILKRVSDVPHRAALELLEMSAPELSDAARI